MSKQFTEKDIEAFKEMGNVGAGHSAIALTKLLKKEVDMSIPFVRIGTIPELLEVLELGNDELVGYEISEINDPVQYRLSVLFKSDVIVRVLDLFASTTKDKITSKNDLTDMQQSLVQEIGSTIILRYIAALNKMMKVESLPDRSPELVLGTAKEALENIGYEEEQMELILIQLDLFTDEYKFACHMFIQPHADSVEAYRKAFFG